MSRWAPERRIFNIWGIPVGLASSFFDWSGTYFAFASSNCFLYLLRNDILMDGISRYPNDELSKEEKEYEQARCVFSINGKMDTRTSLTAQGPSLCPAIQRAGAILASIGGRLFIVPLRTEPRQTLKWVYRIKRFRCYVSAFSGIARAWSPDTSPHDNFAETRLFTSH